VSAAAQELREEGQAQAVDFADMRVVAWIDAAIDKANTSGEEWSANDIRDQFPTVRNGLVGARVDAARKRGEMHGVGFVRSTLPSTRGAWVKRWRGGPA
jgi:hypothetical protein